MTKHEEIKAEIEKKLIGKPYIFRSEPLRKELDGCTSGNMANRDAAGTGPVGAFQIGKRIVYPIQGYVEWLVNRIAPYKGGAQHES